MKTILDSPKLAQDRIKLNFQFDVEQMQQEVMDMKLKPFIYYSVIPLRAPAHLVDFSIPAPDQPEDYADGSWTEWLDTPLFEKSKYLQEVVHTFKKHTKVTLVRLLRLEAGAVVREHTDPTLGVHIEKSVVRFTIPIFSNEAVEFYLNQSLVPMNPGECWYMDLTKPHSIINKGAGERINMSIDMIPNQWVLNQLTAAD